MKRIFTSVGALSLAALLTFGCASTTVEETDIEFGNNTTSGSIGQVVPEFGTDTTSGSIGVVVPEFGTDTTSGSVGNFDELVLSPSDKPPLHDFVLPDNSSLDN